MAVSPLEVKKLRDKTGAGFGDCKEALEKSGGDFEAAEKFLKEKGLASVAKRADRVANEGRIFSCVVGNQAGLMEIACETDFVAKNDDFVANGKALLKDMVSRGVSSPSESDTLKVKELAAVVKENLSIKNYRFISAQSNEVLLDYVHEGRIGALILLKLADASKAADPKVKEFAFDLALHATAFAPLYLNRDKVDQKFIKDQEEIFRNLVINEGKAADKVAPIVQGKVNKYLSQICFLDQAFVKNDKLTVQKAADELGKQLGTKIELADFAYLKIGQEA